MHRPTRNLILIAAVSGLTVISQAQTAAQATSSTKDRWLHVRVVSQQPKNENVRINVPLELAEVVLAAVKDDHLHNGRIRIDLNNSKDVDLRALFEAIRTTKDGEFVTVQSNDEDVRVAKQNGYFLVHVHDKNHGKKEQVEIRIPMKVAEAMMSSGNNELDVAAAIRALASQGDTELVSVKDEEETVRIWLDSKNLSD